MDVLFRTDVLYVATTTSIGISVIPLLVLVVFRPDAKAALWMVAIAFLSSVVVGDALQRIDREAGLSDGAWLNTYVWPPVMFALLTRALLPTILWWLALGAIAFAAWLAFQGPLDHPEWTVTVVGSVIVLSFYLFAGPDDLAPTLVTFCTLASLCYVLYALTFRSYPVATGWWYGYQLSRLGAFGLFARAAWRANA
jgi:hypothetical protein